MGDHINKLHVVNALYDEHWKCKSYQMHAYIIYLLQQLYFCYIYNTQLPFAHPLMRELKFALPLQELSLTNIPRPRSSYNSVRP